MSKVFRPVIDGSTHTGKAAYAVVDGVTRKIKAGYGVVGGVTKQFYASELFGGYTGKYTVSRIERAGMPYDLYTLTTSGILTLGGNAEYWACSGGGGGASADTSGYSGGGGGGGRTSRGDLSAGDHVITIGAGGSVGQAGGNTVIVHTITLAGGDGGRELHGGSGGSGGGAGGRAFEDGPNGTDGSGSGITTYPFGITSLRAHCGGGAGGGADYSRDMTDEELENASPGVKYTGTSAGHSNGGTNGSDGGVRVGNNTSSGTGGKYGGGNADSAATFYGGGGGGGSRSIDETSDYYSYQFNYTKDGHPGYQGVVYIAIPA